MEELSSVNRDSSS